MSDFIKYEPLNFSEQEQIERAKAFYDFFNKRRTVRDFSDKPVQREIIENIIKTASTAPSGAHKQPWTFCLVSNPQIKEKIRTAAEEEEYENYHGRMSERWKEDLKYLGTDWHKPFLETAPYLIVVFKRAFETDADGTKHNNYYVNESVGLACGFLLMAIHNAGLVSLTHTPSPMNFLTKILKRPENERPYLLIPVGYPADDAKVPNLKRKGIKDILVTYE